MPRPYRSRKIAPCDACRRRRAACLREDGSSICSLCKHRGIQCTFLTTPKRRVRPAAHEHAEGSDHTSQSTSQPTSQMTSPPAARSSPTFASATTDPHIQGRTSLAGWTCLLSGLSCDQNPRLLRHLAFDTDNLFGDEQWMVWRVDPRLTGATYLSLYPNQVLDCNIDLYNYDNINKVFSPHQDELINLYYEYLHPSYPILERREIFRAQKNRNEIPCSLLAVVLSHGFEFWSRSRTLKHLNAPNARKLRPYIHAMLTVEIRTPNLGVLQAILLYLQLAPIIVRESNHPGHWGLTCLAVAVAQDIGLHIEPGQWNISIEERKLRRILWWAVYVHDKWIAQWLGRPSHIIRTNWSVLPLTLRDFSNADDMLSVDEVTQGKVFIALCELTEVLDDVLEGFYSVRTNFESMEPDTSRSLGDTILQRLQRWRSSNGQLQSTKDSAHLTVSLCGLTVETLVRKALAVALQTSHGTQHNDEKMATMMSDVSEVIGSIVAADRRQSQQWLSYIRGSLMTIGSQLITMVLSSVDDVKLEQHRERLMTFRGQLVELAQHDETEFARLPLRRLDMIISELLGEDDEIMEDIEPILALDLSGTKSTSDICTAAFNVAMAHMTP